MEPEARTNPGSRGTCALLIEEPGAQSPAPRHELSEALARRSVATRECADRFEAIAHAVFAEESHQAPGAEAASGPLVIILSAEQARRFGFAVHDALQRSAPRSALWVYEQGASPPLSAWRPPVAPPAAAPVPPVVVREAVERMRPNPRPERSGGGSAKPALRLSGEGPERAAELPVVPATGARAEGDAPASAPLLSDEELAMLLSDDWEKDRSGGGGGLGAWPTR